MKKVFALILAALLALSMIAALADGETTETGDTPAATVTYTDVATVTITKTYKTVNGGVSPAETFEFGAFTKDSIAENPNATFPEALPTITSIAYAEGEATAEGTGTGTKTATITLPAFTDVGVYTYKFSEAIPETKTAGVTYKEGDLYLVVTVVEDGGKKRVAAVHCEGSSTAGTYGTDPKTDKFENTYESGTLAVSKTVTGNLGDKSKYFDVTVTFTAPAGEVINSTITYTGGQYTGDVTVENNTAKIQVKNGDTVTFTNIPEGVTYTVEEADYTAPDKGGYDAATYDFSDATDKKISVGDTDTVGITNNKDTTVDTGITLETLPYVLVLTLVLAGAVMMIIRRRKVED